MSERQEYRRDLQRNLATMSRTAGGQLDISSSPDKAGVCQDGLTAAGIAGQMDGNAERAFDLIWSLRDHRLVGGLETADFIGLLWRTLTAGLVAPGAPMLRRHDNSVRFPRHSAAEDLPAAFAQFCQELAERIDDRDLDPVSLAAWIEYRVNLTDHFFSDGCNRVSILLASWALARRRWSLPDYGDRDRFFAHGPPSRRRPLVRLEDDPNLAAFTDFYAGLFGTAEEDPPAEEPPPAPPARQGSLAYEFELELETRYLVEPLPIEDFEWTNHFVDTYDRSGRARIRIKNGRPRFSVKIPLFALDTETVKACLRLELKPATVEQEADLLWLRDHILGEAGAQRVEKWGARIDLPDGESVWLNRDSLGNWWFEVDDGQPFRLPPGCRLLGRSKSGIAVDA